MVAGWEYDYVVRRLIPATVAAFTLVLSVLLASTAAAQVHAGPTSVTSPTTVTSIGFGGHFDRAQTPPITALGPRGNADQNHVLKGYAPVNVNPARSPHRPQHDPFFHGGQRYAAPYPVYILDPSYADSMQQPDPQPQEDYPAGPTIFDRRASGESSSFAEAAYADRMREQPQPEPQRSYSAPAPDAPVADQPQTVLVFKDGHQLEVQNYAIVGNMIYDITLGHRSKIALSDLDLTATAKQNDDRGIDFQLPARPDTN